MDRPPLPQPERDRLQDVLIACSPIPAGMRATSCTTKRDRDFNTHGDLHHNVFIDLPDEALGCETDGGTARGRIVGRERAYPRAFVSGWWIGQQ